MKKLLIRLVAVLLICVLPVLLYFQNSDTRTVAQGTKKAQLSALEALQDRKVGQVKKEIEQREERMLEQQLLEKLKAQRQAGEENVRQQINSGKTTFRQIYADTLIVGDSLMNGLEVYDILDSATMITKVGANLSHLHDNLEKIIEYSPKVLILHYGVNMIEHEQYFIDSFIESYTECVRTLRKGLPETKLVISGLFPVSAKGVRDELVLANCPAYEKRIEKMCEQEGVFYLNNTDLLTDGSGYYAPDGIHVTKSFYTDVWLVYTAVQLGL